MKTDKLKFIIDSRYFNGCCITSMSDGIHNDYGERETLEELKIQENNPYLIAISCDAIYKRSRIYEQSLCAPFHEITEEEYYDKLDVLPPIRMTNHSFFLGEPYHGTLYQFCFHTKGRYFEGLRSVKTLQAELEKQINEHYRNISFHGKIIREKLKTGSDGNENPAIVPYFFLNSRNEKVFICNLTTLSKDDAENRTARQNMAGTLLSLRKHHFMYYTGKGSFDDVEEFMDYMEKEKYTLLANGTFFQYPVNKESATFIGSVKETGEEFIYRIYDRGLFLHLLHRLRSVRRETILPSIPDDKNDTANKNRPLHCL